MQTQDTALIPLRARDGSVRAYAIVDAADADWINQWKWHLDVDGYARRSQKINGKWQTLLMHRELLGLTQGDGLEGDHIDRNTLNDRRNNLRSLPKGKNMQNFPSMGGSSSYRGVSWFKRTRKWRAQVQVDGRTVYVGYFRNEQEAANAARLARARLLPYSVD